MVYPHKKLPTQEKDGKMYISSTLSRFMISTDSCLNDLYSFSHLLSHVQLFVTPWTVAHEAPLSMGFSRQEHWSGLPCPAPGDHPHPRIDLGSPTLQADSFPPSEPPGKPSIVKMPFKFHRTWLAAFRNRSSPWKPTGAFFTLAWGRSEISVYLVPEAQTLSEVSFVPKEMVRKKCGQRGLEIIGWHWTLPHQHSYRTSWVAADCSPPQVLGENSMARFQPANQIKRKARMLAWGNNQRASQY